jgi:hypothetical protein
MRMAKIGRKKHLCYRDVANSRVGKLVGNQLIQLLTHVFRDSLIAMGSHNCTIADVKLSLPSLNRAQRIRCALAGIAFSIVSCGQPLAVYSDLAQIDSTGRVLAPETPREILSPALVRNGFTSFQVVIQAPAEIEWRLFVSQNPEDSLKVALYRELGENLEPVGLPVTGSGPAVFWMDLWTSSDAPLARVKVEPQLWINDDWVVYPMEARVMAATVPSGAQPAASLCPTPSTPLNRLELRDALQDAALASRIAKPEVSKLLSFCDAASSRWSESYLRIRDYLFSLR